MSARHDPGERGSSARFRIPTPWAVLFLGGPTIWYLHFWGVYLVAEAYCSLVGSGRSVLGLSLLPLFVVVTTVLAVVLILWLTWRAWKVGPSPGDRGAFAWTGILLGLLFAVATVFVGLPAVILQPC